MNLKTWLKGNKDRRNALSERLGVTSSAIYLAANGDMRIPPDWYSIIVDVTGGAVGYPDLAPARTRVDRTVNVAPKSSKSSTKNPNGFNNMGIRP